MRQFRQKGTFYRPILEMFLCYGQEDFFECRNNNETSLNFTDLLEQRQRKTSRMESQEAKVKVMR